MSSRKLSKHWLEKHCFTPEEAKDLVGREVRLFDGSVYKVDLWYSESDWGSQLYSGDSWMYAKHDDSEPSDRAIIAVKYGKEVLHG